MVTYTVHEPPEPKSDRVDRATDLEFVKDGFSWLTALFPPLGLLARRLWLPAVGYVVAASLIIWLLTALEADSGWVALFLGALGIYIGFEVSTLKRWVLERGGWRTLGVVNGRSIADCERRFLESWLPGQPVISADGSSSPRPGSSIRESAVPTGLGSRRWPWSRR